METATRISFHGIEETEHDRASITAHIADLEQRFGRITACHITVTAPSKHHRDGGIFLVHIRLALPDGREVNVDRSPSADERHADLPFAINDAFHRARRQLQDHVRELQGQIKTNRARPQI
jgi:ribosome-associated translation inhibitor RaiA